MTYLERASTLLTLAEQLNAAGSWCGETHFQKTTFVLQELFATPLDFRFILYKHGPYSFGLADVITEMRADELVAIQSRHPYGVSVQPTPLAQRIFALCPEPRRRYFGTIKFVASRLGGFGVSDLEKLATAYWVAKECPQCPREERANRMTQLKPHIAIEESKRAIADMEAFQRDALALQA